MKSKIRNLKSAILVLLLCLPAAWPYLVGDIPRSNDSLTHLYRAVELDRLVRSGDLFPRWGPDFVHGLGYPIFNYFAYFSQYLIVLYHFTGLSLLGSLRAAYITAILGAGLSAFMLGKAVAGASDSHSPEGESQTEAGHSSVPALLTAAAYVYSPYLLYTAHVRGGLPENLALAFLPLALWGVQQAVRPQPAFGPKPAGTAVLASLAIAGFIASHIGMAIQYLPLITLWGIYWIIKSAWPSRRQLSKDYARTSARSSFLKPVIPSVLILALILTLALALTAFLWLPSAGELSYVQFEAAFARAGLVYTENFLHISDLLAYPAIPVYGAILNPPVIRALSMPVVGIALSGLLLLKRLRLSQRADYLFLLAAGSVAIFLTLDLSRPLWDWIGLLQRSTFPWRFLGPASLLGAVTAGWVAGHWLRAIGDWRLGAALGNWAWRICLLLLITLVIAFSAPFLFPPREPAPETPTLADLARFEIPPLLIATTTTGEYTPIWVKEFPDTHEMQTNLVEGRQPERLDAPGAALQHLTAEPAHDRYQILLHQSSVVTYRSFYFPGWQATLDGQPLALTPSDPHGLISLNLPAGEHTLDIHFGATPIRTFAGWVSFIGWVLVIGYGLVMTFAPGISLPWVPVLRGGGHPKSVPGLTSDQRLEVEIARSGSAHAWDLGFGVLFLGLVYGSLFTASLFIVRPGLPRTDHDLYLDFGGELTLVGYNQSTNSTLQPEIELVWQAQHPLGVPYGFNVRLTDDGGLVYSDTNIERPRNWRFYPGTDFWGPDQVILDSYILKPLSGVPPGSYQLEVIAYRADTLQALGVQIIGDYLIEFPTNESLADPLLALDDLALIDFQADRTDAAPGDPYRLTLRWQAQTDSPPDQQTELQLVDPAGAVVYVRTETISPAYPPSRWKRGDVLSQEVFFRLPASLPGGDLHWRLSGVELPVSVAPTVRLHLPDRSFELPPLAHPQTADFKTFIQLLGWNEASDGNTVTIELAWRAQAEMADSYRVFLHLLDADGNLVSQSDGEPANWTRPTTSWLPGEVVLDARTLAIPGPGDYSLRVGWVDEAGNRLAEPISLGNIQVP